MIEAFHTRAKANEGIKVPLYLPSGEKKENWNKIRGAASDAFRAAEVESRREAVRIASLDEAERVEAIEVAKRALLASLVIGWSFDKDCTSSNVEEFFHQAPQIADAVDQVATKRSLFFGKGLSGSRPLQKSNSDLVEPQKDQSKPSEQV